MRLDQKQKEELGRWSRAFGISAPDGHQRDESRPPNVDTTTLAEAVYLIIQVMLNQHNKHGKISLCVYRHEIEFPSKLLVRRSNIIWFVHTPWTLSLSLSHTHTHTHSLLHSRNKRRRRSRRRKKNINREI